VDSKKAFAARFRYWRHTIHNYDFKKEKDFPDPQLNTGIDEIGTDTLFSVAVIYFRV
jgi:hypothetical protein